MGGGVLGSFHIIVKDMGCFYKWGKKGCGENRQMGSDACIYSLCYNFKTDVSSLQSKEAKVVGERFFTLMWNLRDKVQPCFVNLGMYFACAVLRDILTTFVYSSPVTALSLSEWRRFKWQICLYFVGKIIKWVCLENCRGRGGIAQPCGSEILRVHASQKWWGETPLWTKLTTSNCLFFIAIN